MKSQKLVYNNFLDNIFFIKQDKKLNGIPYGVARMTKEKLNILIMSIKLIVAKYHFRHSKLHKRLGYLFLPRLNEIKYITNVNKIEEFGIEISKSNQGDILLGLNSFRIQRLLTERGISSIDRRRLELLLRDINFSSS